MSACIRHILLTLLLLTATAPAMAAEAGWQRPFAEVAGLPVRAPDRVVPYGPAASQFVELWLPVGTDTAVPVIVLVHGGCWLAEYGIAHIRPLAASLAQAGFAIWALEYRRVGEAGGGWPGTFRDVAAGIDHLAQLDEPRLDMSRVVLAGHSAGGHLALWAAMRDRLSADSRLYTEPGIRPNGVLGLAAITDLVAYASDDNSCARVTPRLLGGTPFERPERYEQASPAALGSPTNTILLQGEADAIAIKQMALAEAAGVQEKGVAEAAATSAKAEADARRIVDNVTFEGYPA